MNSNKQPETEFDEDEEDLESFLAKCRSHRLRTATEAKKPDCNKPDFEECGRNSAKQSNTISLSPAALYKSAGFPPPVLSENYQYQADSYQTLPQLNDNVPWWQQQEPDGLSQCDPDISLIDYHDAYLPQSPLFVAQGGDMAETSVSNPVETKSGLASHDDEPDQGLERFARRAVPKVYLSTTDNLHSTEPSRYLAAGNTFASRAYVEKIKQNPYTSGIFAYEGLNRAEAYRRAALPSRYVQRQKGGNAAKSTQTKRTASRWREYSSLTFQSQDAKESEASEQSNEAADPFDNDTPATPREHQDRMSDIAMITSQEGLPYHLSRKFDELQDEVLQPITKTDAETLVHFLRTNVQRYAEALVVVESKSIKSSELKKAMDGPVRSDIDALASSLTERQNFNVPDFMNEVDSLVSDLDEQITLKKYMLFNALLRKLVPRSR